ncbi:unnamed protein product [Bursaphelenchus xylophilus]|uniref:(pine wood nematode) hypothetical protein n=1 Tax=Bursaphelenchus xylophilus TaxID=6326 RepID=A0A1I7SEC8_BURXY|nr:unnamed protein product [Bursaphelenchus xylophilus]CAG9087495.1 unnamed protein product [Bursaphelenchus xylophilus]
MDGYDEHLAKDRSYVTKSRAQAALQKLGILLHIGLPICRDHQTMLDKLFSEVTVINAGRNIFPSPETGNFGTAKVIENDEEVYCFPEQQTSQSSHAFSQGSSYIPPSDGTQESRSSQCLVSNVIPPLHCARRTAPKTCEKFYEFGQAAEVSNLQPRKRFRDLTKRQRNRRSQSLFEILKVSADCMAGKDDSEQLIQTVIANNGNSQPSGSADMDELLSYSARLFYQLETRQERIALLSILTRNLPYSYIEKYIPSLSRRYYTESRRYALDSSSLSAPAKRTVTRVNKLQLNQFIDYITGPSVMIGLPFGERKGKTSTGAEILIPNTIRLFRHEQIYRNYIDYLSELGICSGAISRSTALKILNVCSANRRKSLTCIDEFIADADDGFDTIKQNLEEVGDLFEPNRLKSLDKKLMEIKQYLRGDFRLHVKNYSRVPDHCILHSLSNHQDKRFKEKCDEQGENSHEHTILCPRCEMEKQTLGEVQNTFEQLLTDARKAQDKPKITYYEDMTTDFLEAIEKIKNLKRHQVRAAHSNKVREELIGRLKPGEALIVLDFAQKVLQMRFRETQQQYFGKRGMSLHVAHVTAISPNGKLIQHSFLHVLGVEVQDGEAVVAIIRHCLENLKQNGIEKVTLRSDNAGCYHSQGTILSLPAISKQTSVHIEAYEFSEAQAGKSTADRVISTMKRRIRDFVDSGKNVLDAGDLYSALHYPKALHGVSVHAGFIKDRETPQKRKEMERYRNAIGSVTNQYSFTFSTNGLVTYRNFYKIGEGVTVMPEDYKNAEYSAFFKSEQSTDFSVVKFWTGDPDFEIPFGDFPEYEATTTTPLPPLNLAGNVEPLIEDSEGHEEVQPPSAYETRINDVEEESAIPNTAHGTLFECPEQGCGKKFIRLSNLARHIQIGKHEKNPDVVRMEDYVLQAYADKLETLDPRNTFSSITGNQNFLTVEEVDAEDKSNMVKMGWARKPKRTRHVASDAARAFVVKFFEEGKRSKRKYDPKYVAREMKIAKSPTGERLFTANERLNYKQIASMFSRLGREDASAKSSTTTSTEIEFNDELDYRTDPNFENPFDELLERVENAKETDEAGKEHLSFDISYDEPEFIACNRPNRPTQSSAEDCPNSGDDPEPPVKRKKEF